MESKKKSAISLLIWLGLPLVLAAGLSEYYFFQVFYLPSCKNELKKNTIEKGNLLVEMFSPTVKKAIEAGDDLGVMAPLVKIAENPDFPYARVLNSSGTAIAHNNINEWGKIYSGSLTKKIISESGTAVYPRKDPEGYDCSAPIKLSGGEIVFFSVGVSDYKIREEFAKKQNISKKTAGVIFIILFAVIELLLFFMVVKPLKKLKINVESSAMGSDGEEIPPIGRGEINAVVHAVNKSIKDLANNLSSHKDGLESMRADVMAVVRSAVSALDRPYMVLDAAGKIISVSDKSLPGLGEGKDLIEKSVIDIPDADFWAETVRNASDSAMPIVKENKKTGIKVRAASFSFSSGEALGTLILFVSFENRRGQNSADSV
ncbi:PAS domain-containing protein [bacterium]|nr:PAS domain-containing protein [bacterium]